MRSLEGYLLEVGGRIAFVECRRTTWRNLGYEMVVASPMRGEKGAERQRQEAGNYFRGGDASIVHSFRLPSSLKRLALGEPPSDLEM